MPFPSTTVTRFPNGVTNVSDQNLYADMGQDSPSLFHSYYNDFDTYASGDWTSTVTGTGTSALTNGDGGLLLLTNTTGATDAVFSQKVGESFTFASGKKLWFEARLKVSDATASAFVMGLQVTDTTPLAVANGVFFLKSAASTSIALVLTKASTSTTNAAIATAANDTFINLAYFYDGVSTVYYFVNGTLAGSSVTTNLPLSSTTLTVSFGVQNGAAAAKTMTIDYINVTKER